MLQNEEIAKVLERIGDMLRDREDFFRVRARLRTYPARSQDRPRLMD